ncbi:MAG: NfeD family protein [Desulfurobacteriaceae bacterium]
MNDLGLLFIGLGLLLLAVEAFSFTAYLFPAGLGLIAAGVVYLYRPDVFLALLVFFFISLPGYLFSFRYVKKIKGMRNVLSELKKQTGTVVSTVDQFTYEVRFPLGAAGEEVWIAYSEEELSYGDRVKVVGIRGNKLVVEKVEDVKVG